jgi:hypothetical protein
MQNFVKEEGIFLAGAIFLALLVVGTSYAQQGNQNGSAGIQAPIANSTMVQSESSIVTISSSTPAVEQTAVAPASAPKTQATATRVRHREQEYDDE